MANLDKAWAKFSDALYSFAADSPIKDRLYSASQKFIVVTPNDFDGHPDLAKRYETIIKLLTALKKAPKKEGLFPPKNEGRIRPTIRRMRNRSVEQISRMVVDLCFMIAIRRDEE
jgi:hypothetical protein